MQSNNRNIFKRKFRLQIYVTNTTVTKRLTVTNRNVHRLHMFIEYTGLQYLLVTNTTVTKRLTVTKRNVH